ncbi:hypothetical protein DL89DRAFT_314026 [Linderina pennispora]|uniref:RNI-like protein n=1 Tax=Linderina pennispora TaxID=61395 RepID=A0A1Y1WE14_9FUNG|nr:uncharacterized protein DL89DRAFT_314026 [Linderina pennispora]ORX71568.1 hypothetical protein DL89DRAFT_314026 [Linderina pennispora]
MYSDLFIRIKCKKPKELSDEEIELPAANPLPSMPTIAPLVSTPLHFAPARIQPCRVILGIHYEEVMPSLTPHHLAETEFGARSWPSVQDLTIAVRSSPFYTVSSSDYTPLGDVIRYILSKAPNIERFRALSKSPSELCVGLKEALGEYADQITSLDFKLCSVCSTAGLVVPGLACLYVDKNTSEVGLQMPGLMTKTLQILNIASVKLNKFFKAFKEAAVDDAATFDSLRVLDVRFDFEEEPVELYSLRVDTVEGPPPNIMWMPKAAPLTKLDAVGDLEFFESFDITQYPMLEMVAMCWGGPQHFPHYTHFETVLIRPASNLKILNIHQLGHEEVTRCDSGCTSLTTLKISECAPEHMLRHIVAQLPVLRNLVIEYSFALQKDTADLDKVRAHLTKTPSDELSPSLCTIVLNNYTDFTQNATYNKRMAMLIDIMIQSPLFERLHVLGLEKAEEFVPQQKFLDNLKDCENIKALADVDIDVQVCQPFDFERFLAGESLV